VIRFFAAHPTAANLLMVLFLLTGAFTLPHLKRETFPEFVPAEVEVRVAYPGAGPEEVEETVCRRLEDGVDGVMGIEETRCEAREGAGVLTVEMEEGGDAAVFLDDVKTEVEAIDTFPPDVERPVIRQLGRDDHVVSLALSASLPQPELKLYAEDLKDRIQRLPRISLVDVQGFSDHQLRVEIPSSVLRQYRLTIADIAEQISRQSLDLPAGSIETRDREILVRFVDRRRSARELAGLVVHAGKAGGELRLGDLAAIAQVFEDEEEKVVFDGKPAALLDIAKPRSEDGLRVLDALKEVLRRERQRSPGDVEFHLTSDAVSIVRDRLRLMVENGWQGFLLVFATMWVFFGLRFSFWVVMGLPVSFMGTFFFMSLLGQTVNMLTLVALLIALGLLMDDAIVVAESVATQFRQGKKPLDAAVEGVSRVARGVIASFATTVCVFSGLAFVAGDIGQVLRVIPIVLVVTLAVSLVEAFFILPRHLAHALEREGRRPPGPWRRRFDGMVETVREKWVGRVADACVAWRYPFMGAVTAVFLASLGLAAGGIVKFLAFPELDGDILEARLLLPQGTPLERTEEVVRRVVKAFRTADEEFSPREKNGRRLVRHVNVRYNRNLDARESGPHVATVSADLLTAEERRARLDDVIRRLEQLTAGLPDVVALSFKQPLFGPAGLAVHVRLRGEDLGVLKEASLELQRWLKGYRGLYDVMDDLRPGKPELRIRLKEGALALGVDAASIARQLRASFFSAAADEIQVGAESMEVVVQLDRPSRDSLADFGYFPVIAPDGREIPLGSVSEVSYGRGPARIERVNGMRTVNIYGEVDRELANVEQVMADTSRRFLPGFEERYPGVEVSLEGEIKEGGETRGSMMRMFLMGLAGIFLLLSFQFRSYLEPLVVMAAIPLALVGVLWGHWLMGYDLSMPSMMGFVSLAGIVVNDSILLVEFARLRMAEGMSVHRAAAQASRDRFRAVLLTSLTTIAGLLPLLSERSLQAQVLIPLVVSIVFGIFASTLLVLFVIPALYSILEDLGMTRSKA